MVYSLGTLLLSFFLFSAGLARLAGLDRALSGQSFAALLLGNGTHLDVHRLVAGSTGTVTLRPRVLLQFLVRDGTLKAFLLVIVHLIFLRIAFSGDSNIDDKEGVEGDLDRLGRDEAARGAAGLHALARSELQQLLVFLLLVLLRAVVHHHDLLLTIKQRLSLDRGQQ